MGRREKLLEKMRRSPTSVRYDEIENLLLSVRCRVTKRGSHRTFRHSLVPGNMTTIVERHPMKAPCVRSALGLYEEMEEAIHGDSR